MKHTPPDRCWVCGHEIEPWVEVPLGQELTHCRLIRARYNKIVPCSHRVNGSLQLCGYPENECAVWKKMAAA